MNKTLKAKLDRVFSEYIRLRDANKDGYLMCISCGKLVHWKEADAGHYVNRAHMSTRFDEKNVNGQCRFCNRFREGEMLGYTKGLIKKYGEGILDELQLKKNQTSKITDFEAEILVKYYRAQVKNLKAEKNGNCKHKSSANIPV
jgi:hypothetical protein